VDPMTGERSNRKWRVIRLENSFKEKNSPYVEFPARYITHMIAALQAAEQVYLEESRDEPLMEQE